MNIDLIEVGKLYYYSDMDNNEFTAANRAYFESLGAKTWEECSKASEIIFPTLPHKPRPYKRKDPLNPEPVVLKKEMESTKQYFEISGSQYKKLKRISESSGKTMSEILNNLIDNC